MGNMVIAGIVFLLAAGALAVSIGSFREKGYLFNNAYIYASPQEREQMDKRPYYRQTAIAFLLISIIFALLGIEVLLNAHWIFFVVLAVAVATVVYAVASGIAIEKKSK